MLCGLPFFCGYYHHAAPIGRHADRHWGYDSPSYIFPKSLLYWLLEVEAYGDWVMSDFWDCSLFQVYVPDISGNAPLFLKAMLTNCSRSQFLSLSTSFSVGGNMMGGQ